MQQPTSQLTLHVARATRGRDLRHFVREVAKLAGVAHVVQIARFSRLLSIRYDVSVTDAETLIAWARHNWGAVRFIRTVAGESR